ncbi:MAG: glycosyltransferase family 4 protein [Bdellovibrionia bacterium]
MRVALLAPLFERVPPRYYGGTERVVYNLCRGLSAAQVDYTLYASADSLCQGRLVAVVDEPLRLRSLPLGDPIASHFKMLAQVAREAEQYDVIHNHHDYWMLPLTQMSSVPLVSTLHGRLDLPEIRAALLGYPKGVYISISDAQRGPLPELPWLKTVYHGLVAEDFQFYPRPGEYLAFLGRISPEKRPEWAIEIARRSGVPLKIAAKIEGEWGRSYYDTWVKPHVDGRFIEYVGEISEQQKAEFLGKALATVFPIDWPEPFGLVMVESLACGTPVLARPCGSVPEILKEGVTGFLDLDVSKLAARVSEVGTLDRAACRQWVEQRFSLQRMTEDYLHVYRHVVAQKPRGQRPFREVWPGWS